MSTFDTRVIIYSGSDVSPIVRLKNPKTKDPIDLTTMSRIQFVFKQRDRTNLVVDNVQIPATKATVQYEGVTFLAAIEGANGNDIILQFNGAEDIDTVVNNWNAANPTNTVGYTGGLGTDVLPAGTARLTDGYDAYYPVEVVDDPLLGKVKVTLLEKETKLLKRGPNQTFNVIIDFGTFPGGVRVRGVFDKLDVIDDV